MYKKYEERTRIMVQADFEAVQAQLHGKSDRTKGRQNYLELGEAEL